MPTRGEGGQLLIALGRFLLEVHPPIGRIAVDRGWNLNARGSLVTKKNKPDVTFPSRANPRSFVHPLACPHALADPTFLFLAERDRSIELNPLNFIGHGGMTFR